ncbi:MAG TPA: MTAP family purine nucleoside phosphorylase [Solirubrobacteraceae bacterium]|jgi:purine nucleoside phosphorylase|nr:MTAP family purine nucleoside phosphorylase [Solirubrobacteraceae bacterium]
MPIGIITGSGTYALPDFDAGDPAAVDTPWGEAQVTQGTLAGVEVLHISRHGPGHRRLSSGVNHRANAFALRELGATAVLGCTACGAVDPSLELGSLVIFDDLHFISNRLPSGELCTFFAGEGDPARAHWVLHGGPFSERLRACLEGAAAAAGLGHRGHGTYGHVDGPRFNTPTEIAQLAACGVSAVSQTGGPETVLCGELELPYALIGFVTDYANEVVPGDPTPVATLTELMGRSSGVFAEVLRRSLPNLAADPPRPAGTLLRFGAGHA